MERLVKILVTGGLGYIGSNIALYLSRYDSFKVSVAGRNKSFSHIINNENIDFIKINYESSLSINKKISGFDIIIHCAGMSAELCNINPKEAYKFNSYKTEEIAMIANKLRIKKFINFSTAHVYTNKLSGFISENNEILNDHPYAKSNFKAEELLNRINKNYEIQCISIRLSNVIGLPLYNNCKGWDLLVNDLCKQIFYNGKIKLNTNGMQRRNFVTMNDLNRLMKHMIINDFPMEKYPIYNFGGNWNPSVYEVSLLIKKIHKELFPDAKKIEIQKLDPELKIDKDKLIYDNTKISSTGFTLKNDYNSSIRKILLYCKKTFNK